MLQNVDDDMVQPIFASFIDQSSYAFLQQKDFKFTVKKNKMTPGNMLGGSLRLSNDEPLITEPQDIRDTSKALSRISEFSSSNEKHASGSIRETKRLTNSDSVHLKGIESSRGSLNLD
jgi:hypothetical protein